MYVVAHHRITDPQVAFQRGEKLIQGVGAPAGTRNLQFYPSRDGSAVTCLWEAPSVEDVQAYVDATMDDAAVNTCYEVDSEQAYAARPAGMPESPGVRQ